MGTTKTLVDSSRNFNPYGQTTAEAVLSALRPYKLKDLGGGRYRCNSPFRPDSNSHAFSLTISDGEHGGWLDHVSGESGSLYDLAESLGVRDGYGYDAPAPAPTKPKPERPPKPEPPAAVQPDYT